MNKNHYNPAWYLEPYVWLLISFPLAAVIGGIITIVLAVQSDDGLVVDDYYKKGLEINLTLARDRRAETNALSARLQYAPGDPEVRIILFAREDFQFPPSLQVSFLNAARKGMDHENQFQQRGTNIYYGENPQLQRGKWHLLIETADWRLQQVFFVD